MAQTWKAGDLDVRIDVQRVTTQRNALNEPIETWATVIQGRPAAYREISTGERMRADEHGAAFDARFIVRGWKEDILTTDRILFRGRSFAVVGKPREIGSRTSPFREIMVRARGEGVR